jgi:D-serine deaminase-like pyridoxal phosphate-dependent protein
MATVTQPVLCGEVGQSIDELDTPCLLVDLDIAEANIATLFSTFKDKNVAVRPHLKTAKCPEFAKLFLAAGAAGVCVSKLSEAEVMVKAGISDILITTEIAGKIKIERYLNLVAKSPDVKVVVDHLMTAKTLDEGAKRRGIKPKVLIEINVGQDRCGVAPGESALELAMQISKLSNIELVGVQGYEGHLQHIQDASERQKNCESAMTKLRSTADMIRSAGIPLAIVTTGGTGTSEFCAGDSSVTEVQPGSFVFMDKSYSDAIGTKYRVALTVLSTVISTPAKGRAVIDAGWKSLSIDSGPAHPGDLYGVSYTPAGDEHGHLKAHEGDLPLELGDKVKLIPSHIDTTLNLFDHYYCHRKGKIVHVWEIAGRGKVQ